ncbi:phage tail domain-containing protein [Clostridium oceanicum]|uniref:Phage tail protein n=1 Tax=Clostridium oceanicum TaxID=1543 RepID=A0ABN1JC63_9CLOT
MECSIKLINLRNKEEINIESYVKENGVLCTKFQDNQPKGEFTKIKGVNQIGQSVNSTSLTERDIVLEGIIIGKDRNQVEIFKKQLVSILNPMDKILIQYTNDYVKKEIKVVSISVPVFSIELNTKNLLGFMVNLEAPYPLWQDQKESITNIETWEGGLEFPFELTSSGFELARKGPNEIELVNSGQMEAPLEFYFKAPALNPKIILNNNQYIKVNKKINDGEMLYISTAYGMKRVEIIKSDGRKENAYNYIDINSCFFKLFTGYNIISYSTEGSYIPQSVIVKYKNQYLSL